MDQATLMDKIKTGTTLCKAIMRNGYDAMPSMRRCRA